MKQYKNCCFRLELVRETNPRYAITGCQDVFEYVKNIVSPILWKQPYETFGFIGLTSQNKIIITDFTQNGTTNESKVYISELAKKLLLSNSSNVILIHNHPSGADKISEGDLQITTKIQVALKLFDIKVLDHLIITGENDYISFKEKGYL